MSFENPVVTPPAPFLLVVSDGDYITVKNGEKWRGGEIKTIVRDEFGKSGFVYGDNWFCHAEDITAHEFGI
jgi:hypothetical protein